MAARPHAEDNTPLFGVDLELEQYLDVHDESPDEARAALKVSVGLSHPGNERERALSRIGRVADHLYRELQTLERYEQAIREDIATERAFLERRLAVLNDVIKDAAEDQRDELDIKSLLIPGVGRWQTRGVPASWSTEDEEAAAVALLKSHPDEAARFVSRRPVVSDKEGLKAWLDQQGLAEFPGMLRKDERLSVKGPFDK